MKRYSTFFLPMCMVFGLMLGMTAAANTQPQLLDMEDGKYAIEVTLEGGSGKATVVSPCSLEVVDGQGYALLQWSSPNYDYMIVDGVKYLPENEEGNSEFVVPILVYDEKMPVIADTTAMGTPHEVNYSLTFYRSGIMGANETPQARARYSVYMAIAIIVVCMLVSQFQKRSRKKKMRALTEKRFK